MKSKQAQYRRRTELGLIVFGTCVIALLYVLAGFGKSASVPADLVPFFIVVLGLGVLTHLAVRKFAPYADPIILPLVIFLNGLGQVFISRLSHEKGIADELPALQSTWTAIGVAAFILVLVFVRNSHVLKTYRYTFGFIGIFLLILPLLPIVGREINGSRIWASFGPINLQPGEFARLALTIFLASYLVEKSELLQIGVRKVFKFEFPSWRHLSPVLLAWGIAMLVLAAEKDFGSSLLYFALFTVMLWAATQRFSYLLISFGLFFGGALISWKIFDHIQARVSVWNDPWEFRSGSGYQLVEAALAMANGGLTGTGLGNGEPNRIPEVETDFIFAAIGEEMGLLGTVLILSSFLFIIGSGLRIAIRSHDAFDKLLAVGLTTLIGLQGLVIMGGIVRLLPLTGVTLPFVSYGGSSLLANYMLVALLLRLSDQATTSTLEDKNTDETGVS
ncbi:MAG: putative FtsW-like protein [Acidimicrobiales bacterium AG-410-I20]|nr:MAG: putative FtsW-like protein [Acidimicrobiales bacterium AG-410-I20]